MRREVLSLSLAVAVSLAVGACARQQSDTPAEARDTQPATPREADRTISDSWITTKVQAQYFADPAVKGRNIDVNTSGGDVTLTGHVDTEEQKSRAEQLAKQVDGVRRVDNRLTVGAGTQAAGHRPGTIGSAWITTKVQAQLFADEQLRGSDVDVDTNNGIVTLAGTVPSTQARDRAIAIARATDDVRDVENRLRIATETRGTSGSASRPDADDRDAADRGPVDDASITMRIQARYFSDDEVRGRNIDVDTSHGTVRLQGEVGSETERRQAVRLARTVPGVVKVEDQLRLVPDKSAAADRSKAAGGGQPIEDAWITTKIQSKYFVEPSVGATAIDVTTRAGTVTLTGKVDTQQGKRRAVEIARETSGVRQVVDRLVVDAPGGPSTNH